ncbi:unnamed protein product [Brassica oleracea var. botrytis]|uniref:(rape) hypothetical protein n=1 Tax=Brassica napus TaxID=3708 RepID=A0A816Q0E2_BRANA|nr:unnamed protein product [Brassica napus]
MFMTRGVARRSHCFHGRMVSIFGMQKILELYNDLMALDSSHYHYYKDEHSPQETKSHNLNSLSRKLSKSDHWNTSQKKKRAFHSSRQGLENDELKPTKNPIQHKLIRSFRWLGTWMIGDFFYLVERNVTCGGREMVFTNLIGVDLRLRMVSKLPKKENSFQREM